MTDAAATAKSTDSTLTPLSTMLKDGTTDKHRLVERTEVMSRLMSKTITRTQYTQLLARYYFMYEALEHAAASLAPTSPTVAAVYFPQELSRLESLIQDLKFYIGDKWESNEVVMNAKNSPATKAFVGRINSIKEGDSGKGALLLSHMYVRYLGDLAGGQMISKKIERAFELEGSDGVKFYLFDKVANPKVFMKKFKDGMDSVTDVELKRSLVEEANVAYELNFDILTEVDKLLLPK